MRRWTSIRINKLIQEAAAAVALGGLLVGVPGQGSSAAQRSTVNDACPTWSVRTILSGQGWLESLAFDGRGSIIVSALSQGRLLELSRSGALSVLLSSVPSPGGEVRRGHLLYFETGDATPATPTGTIDRLDLRTGRLATWARGLTMPNGLVILRGGDALVTSVVSSLARVPARDPTRPRLAWAPLGDTNGIAVDKSGRWLYVDRTLSSDGEVDRIPMSDPRRVEVVGRLGKGTEPDDMTTDAQGFLYVAGFGTGEIYRLDPRTGTSCAIARGLTEPTAAVSGGPGWPSGDLFVTDGVGHLSELTPPVRSGSPR